MPIRQKGVNRQCRAILTTQFLQQCAMALLILFLSVLVVRGDNRIVTVVYENEPKIFTSESGRPSGMSSLQGLSAD